MTGALARTGLAFSIGLALVASSGCGGRMPGDLGLAGDQFKPCPDSPNCVSSFATDEQHGIAAIQIDGPSAAAWQALELELESRARVAIVTRSDGYLHAVFTSKLMRYRDDVEFHLNAAGTEIGVRSASRVGYGDMNANRNRVESIRTGLAERGVARAATDD
jgi:uncharacterized protein (DUF1499 family)